MLPNSCLLKEIDVVSSKGIVVIIPTRNRARLAINAINSVLAQCIPSHFQILVSDNSTNLDNSIILGDFCEKNREKRVRYIRPSESLAMADHWDWAINRALELYDLNHFLFLPDRWLFKKRAMQDICILINKYPNRVISYNYDTVLDHKKPICVAESEWSGKILEIESSRLIYLSSECIIHSSLPKMLNCVVPRPVLGEMKEKFGNIFGSISPDYCFAYRCLLMEKSILYYDKSLIVGYALQQSNGSAFQRGVLTETRRDFEETLAGRTKFNSLSPIPEIRTAKNAMIHEYYFVKQENKTDKLPDINFAKYLSFLATDICDTENEINKMHIISVLRNYGWKKTIIPRLFLDADGKLIKPKKLLNLVRVWKRLISIIRGPQEFEDSEKAIEYAVVGCPKTTSAEYIKYLEEHLGSIVDYLPETVEG